MGGYGSTLSFGDATELKTRNFPPCAAKRKDTQLDYEGLSRGFLAHNGARKSDVISETGRP
ncbi:MAG: hypothetical protein DMG49_10595 [Acidobacteria bacterium]|nr:MAG: hypothetical protein DMG49_10595 [Acidobacteriota bacterium]